MNKVNRNISIPFSAVAHKKGEVTAVWVQTANGYEEISFKELELLSSKMASGLAQQGFEKGTRTLLMIKPGIPFVVSAMALFKAGAVPVFIDPGMGIGNLLNSIRQVDCRGFIGIPKAHILRLLFRKNFKSIDKLVTIGNNPFWGGTTYQKLIDTGAHGFQPVLMGDDDTAAIIFTTGSTGPPKGVTYTHGMYQAQLEIIRTAYGVQDGDVDLSAFPLFALFAVTLGMSAVIPDMDPTRPARVNPDNIVNAVNDKKVTFTFGSPAIWERVSAHCVEKGIKLPTLTRVLMAGAPVASRIHDRLLNKILPPGAQTHTPYGATESLPIADMTGTEALEETAELTAQGHGICVGRPLPPNEVRVIKLSDDPIEEWDDALLLPEGEIGEIAVKGPVVSREYFRLEGHNRTAKMHEGEAVWHRMGDIGYYDVKGRLWFCGRKNHRVITKETTLYTICSEAFFNQYPKVARSALVGLGKWPNQRPVIIIEPERGVKKSEWPELEKELKALASRHPETELIEDILFHHEFPTDIRHNAKIFREKLKVWAEQRLPDRIPA